MGQLNAPITSRHIVNVVRNDTGSIAVSGGGGSGGTGWSLGTLPLVVVSRLLERAPRGTPEGAQLRRDLMALGAPRLLLACLAVFTHHHHASSNDVSTQCILEILSTVAQN